MVIVRLFLTGVIPRHFFLYIILFKIIVVSLTLVTLHNSLNTIINRQHRVNSWPIQRGMYFEMAAKTNRKSELLPGLKLNFRIVIANSY